MEFNNPNKDWKQQKYKYISHNSLSMVAKYAQYQFQQRVKVAESSLKEQREEAKRKDSEIHAMQKELSKVQESIKAIELSIQKCQMNAKTEEENANQMKHIVSWDMKSHFNVSLGHV